MRSVQDTYLSLLRWDSPFHILLICGLVLALISPVSEELAALMLFLGMILRTRSCGIRPSVMPPGLGRAFILLVPLWPALVAVDDLWSWMQRVGFGPVFRVSVTAVLFAVSWIPFLELTTAFSGPLLIGAASASALLRERGSGYWYLVPSMVPIGIVGASW